MILESMLDMPEGEKDWAAIQEARRIAEEQRTEKQRDQMIRGKKIYLGHEGPEKHEGWTGSLPFYLFWCDECEHWAKDYPHGHEHIQYLMCPNCDAYHDFVSFGVQLRIWRGELKLALAMLGYRLGLLSNPFKQGGTVKEDCPVTVYSCCDECGMEFEEQSSSISESSHLCRKCRPLS